MPRITRKFIQNKYNINNEKQKIKISVPFRKTPLLDYNTTTIKTFKEYLSTFFEGVRNTDNISIIDEDGQIFMVVSRDGYRLETDKEVINRLKKREIKLQH